MPTSKKRPVATKKKTAKRRATTQKTWPKLFWFVHHEVPVEWVDSPDDLRDRIRYIRQFKAKNEVPNRLRAMKVVRRRMPVLTRLANRGAEYFSLSAAETALLRQQLKSEYPRAPIAKHALRVEGT